MSLEPRDGKAIIEAMKSLADFKTDSALADYLGVSKVTIATWRKRNSVPLEKCLLFCQKSLIHLDNLIFGDDYLDEDQEWIKPIYAAVVHFYEKARGSFLYGDKWQTSLWWGEAWPYLTQFYEHEIFALGQVRDLSFEEAALEIMKTIDDLQPAEMVDILERRLERRANGRGGSLPHRS